MQNNEEGNKWSFGIHQLTRHPEKKKETAGNWRIESGGVLEKKVSFGPGTRNTKSQKE
jgi:hypothetical protein